MDEETKKTSPHSGHRQRLKERFLAEGMDAFTPHEVIELLLFYVIPRQDVNELAHRLIERFGSVPGVIEADYYDLLSVEGIGPSAAQFFCTLCGLLRRYSMDKDASPRVYSSIHDVGKYAVNLFVGVRVERLYALLFDNGMRFIDEFLVAEGTVNSVSVHNRTILTRAIRRNASSVILVHNHPDGSPMPSQNDVVLTDQVAAVMETAGINLIDHLVVSGKYYTPILMQQRGANLSAGTETAAAYDTFCVGGKGGDNGGDNGR